eukprot:IDg11826t1
MARILALFVLIAASAVAAQACYSGCRFRFCDYSKTVRLGYKADVAITGAICDKYGHRVGVVNTGEAHLVRTNYRGRKYLQPISRWSPYGLKQKFSPHFFKAFTIRKI